MPPRFNSSPLKKMMGLEDHPFLLGWYILRGELLNFQGVTVSKVDGFLSVGRRGNLDAVGVPDTLGHAFSSIYTYIKNKHLLYIIYMIFMYVYYSQYIFVVIHPHLSIHPKPGQKCPDWRVTGTYMAESGNVLETVCFRRNTCHRENGGTFGMEGPCLTSVLERIVRGYTK